MAVSTITNKQQTGFWNSAAVKKSIAETIDRLQFTEQDASWQTLRNAVIHLNRKFPRNGPPPTGLAIEEIEGSDKWHNYPRLRGCLFAFADLLIRFHQRMSKKHGKDYLDQVRTRFRHDPQAHTFLAVYETYIGSRLVLVHALEKISRNGIDFKTIGGIESGYRHRDCGIEPLVELSGAIERRLKSLSNKKRKAQKVAVNRIDPNTRPQVIVEYLENGKLTLWYQKKSVNLSGLQAKLVTQLFDPNTKKAVPYRELWKALYPKLPYTSKDTGPPERLKTLKIDLQRKLTETFDEPPHKSIWILAEKNVGYSLNYRVVNWRHAKVFSRTRAKPMDPGVLDSIVVRDKYR
jgi:hypothetical protein